MISAEAPVLFAKAAEIFVCELSLRAWIHTEDNKRRTLQVKLRIQLVSHSSVSTILNLSFETCDEFSPDWNNKMTLQRLLFDLAVTF